MTEQPPEYKGIIEMAARLDREIDKVRELKMTAMISDYIILDYIEKVLKHVKQGDQELAIFT